MNTTALSIKELWDETLQELRKDQPEDVDIWLQPVEILHLENQVIALKVPNKLFADGIRDRFQTKLLSILERRVGHHLDIVYKIAEGARTMGPAAGPAASPSPLTNLPISTLNPRYSFSSFVVGASNRYAHATAEAISKAPGTQYNPYFIYGGVGLGKTHLMHGGRVRSAKIIPMIFAPNTGTLIAFSWMTSSS